MTTKAGDATAARLIIDPQTELRAPETWSAAVPVPDEEGRFYWDAFAREALDILRCEACRRWVHPPLAACPACHSMTLQPEPVAGVGTIHTFTIVNREFTPGLKPPYVAVLVELDEQPGLRVLSNVVGCRIADVDVGRRVEAVFVPYEEHTMLYFTPIGDAP